MFKEYKFLNDRIYYLIYILEDLSNFFKLINKRGFGSQEDIKNGIASYSKMKTLKISTKSACAIVEFKLEQILVTH